MPKVLYVAKNKTLSAATCLSISSLPKLPTPARGLFWKQPSFACTYFIPLTQLSRSAFISGHGKHSEKSYEDEA